MFSLRTMVPSPRDEHQNRREVRVAQQRVWPGVRNQRISRYDPLH